MSSTRHGSGVPWRRLVPVTLPDTEGHPVDQRPGTEEEPVHYLAYANTPAIGKVVEHMIATWEEPLHLNRVFVSHMAAVLKAMSSEGRGTAWLPESHLTREFAEGTLFRAGGKHWDIPVEVRIIRSRDPLPDMAEELWALLPGEEDCGWG